MLVVYIAGPFRGNSAWDIELNIRNAEALSLQVWANGMAALCPHTNTRFFQGTLPDDVWLNGDIALLDKCDALLLTSDWKRSSGARAERQHAEIKGLPVFENIHDLIAYKVERESA